MNCKICGHSSGLLFRKRVLLKYDIAYFRCEHCLFIQTEEPHWLTEAYAEAITSLDIGLVQRNLRYAPIVHAIIHQFFDPDKRFLDFGGGYGLLVRIMRDRGLDYYRQDKFCENLFAKHFDTTDTGQTSGYEMVTAFELFEHLPDPLQGIGEMLGYGKNIFFSTILSDDQDLDTWWYIAPETGQHVAIYHHRTLLEIAAKFGLHLYSNGVDTHMLSEKAISPAVFRILCKRRVASVYAAVFARRPSMVGKDLGQIRETLRK